MMMSQRKEKKSKEKRRIKDLPPKEKQLTKAEARKVKGCGTLGAATVRHIGEEIPQ